MLSLSAGPANYISNLAAAHWTTDVKLQRNSATTYTIFILLNHLDVQMHTHYSHISVFVWMKADMHVLFKLLIMDLIFLHN